jgi:hypothetical protein
VTAGTARHRAAAELWLTGTANRGNQMGWWVRRELGQGCGLPSCQLLQGQRGNEPPMPTLDPQIPQSPV